LVYTPRNANEIVTTRMEAPCDRGTNEPRRPEKENAHFSHCRLVDA
jgi:hypothetical protein